MTPQARRERAAQQEAEQVVLAFDAWKRGSEVPPRSDERLLFSERHLAGMVRDALLAFADQEVRVLEEAVKETMEEIAYWHQDYLDDTDAPSNGWRRVYDKLSAALRQPPAPPA
jgi:hypothetical protein